MKLEQFFEISPYSMSSADKQTALKENLMALTMHHYNNCPEYKRILDMMKFDFNGVKTCADLPFIPVRLFKNHDLCSVPRDKIVKTLTSSGTTSQTVSKILLDAENVKNQTKTLNEIISSFIGKQRLPLLLLDTELIKKDRSMYSARGAGIIGFSIFGRDTKYALDSDMNIDIDTVTKFLAAHQDETILMFGYTYLIWQFIVRAMEERGLKFNVKNAILFHIGGWKKLKDQAVDADEFNRRIRDVLGNVRVYNYYGMAEQLGSVFVECEYGHMHCSNYSDIIIRHTDDFSVANVGESGLIELLSILPTSYPGHVLLTEDQGVILGEDDCPCGRMGKYFKILGRLKNAEIRGCSDTFEKH